MNRSALLVTLFLSVAVNAQTPDDIPVEQLPPEVKALLDKYLAALRGAKTLEDAAKALAPLAGGGLVNEDGKTLRDSVAPFSLKKDWSNVKFYADPVQITRVVKRKSGTEGFGPSAIGGTRYTMYIAKKEGVSGMPAPISITVPEGHATIKEPRVTGIGSF
jgi:hypothetical protein